MSHKIIKTSGWILTIVLALMFAFSAFLKLSLNETALAQATSLGMDAGTFRMIGLIEAISLLLFLLPRTGVLGSLLLIAYMGGAIATHLQHQQPVAVAVIVETLIWVAVALRFPELLQRLVSPRQALTSQS
jgi:hypothetical protein